MKHAPFILLLASLGCISACKKMDNHLSFCDTVNVKRNQCDPGGHYYCDQALATAQPGIVNKINACPYTTPPDVIVVTDPFPEMGAVPCCLSYAKPPTPTPPKQ